MAAAVQPLVWVFPGGGTVAAWRAAIPEMIRGRPVELWWQDEARAVTGVEFIAENGAGPGVRLMKK